MPLFTTTPLVTVADPRRASLGADPGSDFSTGTKVAFWAIVVGAVSLGVYSWYKDQKTLDALTPQQRLEERHRRTEESNKAMMYGAGADVASGFADMMRGSSN